MDQNLLHWIEKLGDNMHLQRPKLTANKGVALRQDGGGGGERLERISSRRIFEKNDGWSSSLAAKKCDLLVQLKQSRGILVLKICHCIQKINQLDWKPEGKQIAYMENYAWTLSKWRVHYLVIYFSVFSCKERDKRFGNLAQKLLDRSGS